MTTAKSDAALPLGRPAEPNRSLRSWWSVITAALVAAVFIEAVFAGAMLSGAAWAREAHRLTATILIASALIAGAISAISLRRIPRGPTLGWLLLGLAAGLFAQAALGMMSAKGANLVWAHVPLGVALVALAGQAAAQARRLGGNDAA